MTHCPPLWLKQEEINKKLEDVLVKFEYNKDESIYDYLDKLEVDQSIKDIITYYLEARGIMRV